MSEDKQHPAPQAHVMGGGTVSIGLMQRIWANLYYDEEEAGGTFQSTLNEVVDWLSSRDALTLRKDGFAAGFEAQQAGADEDANPYEEGSDQWRDWNEGWESANDEEPEDTPSPQPRVRGID